MAFDFAASKYRCDYESGAPGASWRSCKENAHWAIASAFGTGANHYCTRHKLIVEKQLASGDSSHMTKAPNAEWRRLIA